MSLSKPTNPEDEPIGIWATKSSSSSATPNDGRDDSISNEYGRRIRDIIEHGIDQSIPEMAYEEAKALINIKNLIGEGGFAKCFSAKMEIRGVMTDVAIKRVKYENVNEMYYLQYEINVTGSLKHRHIAKIFFYA